MLPTFINYPEIVRIIINYSKSIVTFNWAQFKKNYVWIFAQHVLFFLNNDDK